MKSAFGAVALAYARAKASGNWKWIERQTEKEGKNIPTIPVSSLSAETIQKSK